MTLICTCYDIVIECCCDSSFWSDFWPEFVCTIIGFGGAYFLYWLGLRNESKRYYEYVKSMIPEMLKSSEGFAQKNKNAADKIGERDTTIDVQIIDDIVKYQFVWYETLDNAKLQSAFIKFYKGAAAEKNQAYNELITNINLLHEIAHKASGDFWRFLERSNQFESEFKNAFKLPLSIWNVIKLKRGTDLKLDSFESKWVELLSTWESKGSKEQENLYVLNELFLQKLLKAGGILHRDFIDYRNIELIQSFIMSDLAFKQLEKNDKFYSILFHDYSKDINKAIEKINRVLVKM